MVSASGSVGKDARIAVYLEPNLYVVAQAAAEKDGQSLSAWVRRLVLYKLLEQGQVSNSLLVEIAL